MIRFFISSTFRDMQTERDAIHKSIYPVIREYGLERGVNVDICDLRWGIEFNSEWSEEESIAEIMKVCFTEVKDCKPHIVAMIGNYYGSKAPNKELIIDLWKSLGRSTSELPEDTDISLTQWELEFSFLSKSYSDTKSLCLFKRDISTPRDEEVVNLENRIKNKENDSAGLVVCQDYSSINQFEQIFIEYAKKRIDEEAIQESETNWVENEFRFARAYCTDRCVEFAGRDKYIKALDAFLNDRRKKSLLFYGQSGIGKSSLMSKLFQLTDSRFVSEIIMCGISQTNSYYQNVLIEIIYIIEKQLNENCRIRDDLFTEESAEKYLEKILQDYDKDTIIFIFVDAMDKLSVVGKNRLMRIFDNDTTSNVKLICSQIQAVEENDYSNLISLKVEPLTENDVREILAKRLFDANQIRNKEDSPVIDAIIKKEGAISPLYIKAVINVLKMHMSDGGTIQNKDEYFVSVLERIPDGVADICWFAFREAMTFVFDKNESGYEERIRTMEDAIGLIAVSRFGLREKDLECIMSDREWTNVSFSALRLFLRDFFRQFQDGCWTFEHDIIVEGIINHFNNSGDGEKKLYRQLYSYVISEECNDLELKIKEGLYLSYYFDNGDMTIELLKEIGDYPILPIRTIAAKELEYIITKDIDYIWYKGIIRTDMNAVMGALSSLLEIRSGEDYARRIPARFAADLFWEIESIDGRESIEKWSKQSERTFFEKQLMASLCAEYVGVYEDSGDRITTVGYSFFPKEFYMNKNNLTKLSESEKHRAYRQMGTLFNINNAVISNFNNYSRDIMSWFEEDPLDLKEIEKGVTSRFIGNKAQYYSAVGNIRKSLDSRLHMLGNNIKKLFEKLGSQFDNEKEDFSILCNAKYDEEINILQLDIDKQINNWKNIIHHIVSSTNYSKDDYKMFSQLLDAVARSYFVICYDINKINKDVDDYELFIQKACQSIEASITIFGSVIVENRRELFSSYIRRIQINTKKDISDRNSALIVLGWGIQAIDEYIDNADALGFSTGNLLRRSLSEVNKKIESILEPEDYAEYLRKYERLKRRIYD